MGCNYAKNLKQRQRAEHKRRQEETCSKKERYPNDDTANRRVDLYLCPHCGWMHHTHRKPRIVNPHIAERKANDVLDQFR